MMAGKAALHCNRLQKCYCGFCFSVHHGKFGMLFSDMIPLEEACEIMQYYAEKYGYDICDYVIAHHFKCSFCLTTKENSDKWRKEIGIDT